MKKKVVKKPAKKLARKRQVKKFAFAIDRGTWLTGAVEGQYLADEPNTRVGTSCLLDPDSGFKCCLGFYATACGVSERAIVNTAALANLHANTVAASALPDVKQHVELFDKLMNVNDSHRVKPKAREKQIAKLFQKLDVEVTFTGTYPKVEQ